MFILMLWAAVFVWNLWAAAIQTLVALGFSIAVTVMFWRLDTIVGILMAIVTAWLLFATILQWWVAFYNKRNEATGSVY
jgi:tryptophan-rich sensory protein